jgi:hypothetical protein
MGVVENRGGAGPAGGPFAVFGWLFDFQVGRANLLPDHTQWLTNTAVTFLNQNPNATFALIGSASRSGSALSNYQVAAARVDTVFDFLVNAGVSPAKSLWAAKPTYWYSQRGGLSAGEVIPATAGQPDGTEDPMFRAVLVELWGVDVRRLAREFRAMRRRQARMPI